MAYTGANLLTRMTMAQRQKQTVNIRRGKFGLKYNASDSETYDVIQDAVEMVIKPFPSDAQLLEDGRSVDIPDYKGRLFAPIANIAKDDIVDRGSGEPLLFVVDINHPNNSQRMSLDLRSEVQN